MRYCMISAVWLSVLVGNSQRVSTMHELTDCVVTVPAMRCMKCHPRWFTVTVWHNM